MGIRFYNLNGFFVKKLAHGVNFIFIGIGVAACVKRKYYRLIPAALLMPFYWLLISLAAWKGFIQIFTKPFYWEKTKHGLTDNIEPCKEETA